MLSLLYKFIYTLQSESIIWGSIKLSLDDETNKYLVFILKFLHGQIGCSYFYLVKL